MAKKIFSKSDIQKALGFSEPRNSPKQTKALMVAMSEKQTLDEMSGKSKVKSPSLPGLPYDSKVTVKSLNIPRSESTLAGNFNTGVSKLGDLLSRGQYTVQSPLAKFVDVLQHGGSAGDAIKSIPRAALDGATGKSKASLIDTLKKAGLPEGMQLGPGSIIDALGIDKLTGKPGLGKAVNAKLPSVSVRDAAGLIGDVGLDPLNAVHLNILKGANEAEKAAAYGRDLVKNAATHEAELKAQRAAQDALKPVGKAVKKDLTKTAEAKPVADNFESAQKKAAVVVRDKGKVVDSPVIRQAQNKNRLAGLGLSKKEPLPTDVAGELQKLTAQNIEPVQGTLWEPTHAALPTDIPAGVAKKPATVEDAIRNIQIADQQAVNVGVKQAIPDLSAKAASDATALKPGRLELNIAGTNIIPNKLSEALYRGGKSVKDSLLTTPGIEDTITRGFNTDYTIQRVKNLSGKETSKMIPSYGTNATRRRTINAEVGKAVSAGLDEHTARTVGEALAKKKILDKFGVDIPAGPLRTEAEQNGLVHLGEGKYVPKSIADNMAAWKQEGFKPPSSSRVVGLLKKVRGAWMTQAIMSPGTQLMNLAGDGLNNAIAGVKLKEYAPAWQAARGKVIQKEIADVAGRKMSAEEAMQGLVDSGLWGTSRSHDVAESIKSSGKGFKTVAKVADKATTARENVFRAAHWFDALEKVGPHASSVQEAFDMATERLAKVNHDFTDLTPFEKSVKNFLVFYSWPRKNLPLVAKNLVENPGKVAAIYKGEKAMNIKDGQASDLIVPGYEKGYPTVGTNKTTLASTVLNINTPYSDVFRILESPRGVVDVVSQLMPDIKAVMELGKGDGKKFSGGPTGSVVKYVASSLRIPKLIMDLKDPDKTANEKQQVWERFISGVDVREITPKTKKGIAQAALKKTKNKTLKDMGITPALLNNKPANVSTVTTLPTSLAPTVSAGVDKYGNPLDGNAATTAVTAVTAKKGVDKYGNPL